MIKLQEIIEKIPSIIYHTYEGPTFNPNKIDFNRGIFCLEPWWVGKRGYEEYDEFHPNEFGSKVVAIQIDTSAKLYTASDQFEILNDIFPRNPLVKQMEDNFDNSENIDIPTQWKKLDTLIGKSLKKRGYQLIHYTEDPMYNDVWVIIDDSIIKKYWHKNQNPGN